MRNSQMVPSHLLSLHPIACLEDTTVCECVSVCVWPLFPCQLLTACVSWLLHTDSAVLDIKVLWFTTLAAEGTRWRRPSVKVKNHWVNSAVVYSYTVTTSVLSQMCSKTFSWRQIIEFFLLSLSFFKFSNVQSKCLNMQTQTSGRMTEFISLPTHITVFV